MTDHSGAFENVILLVVELSGKIQNKQIFNLNNKERLENGIESRRDSFE